MSCKTVIILFTVANPLRGQFVLAPTREPPSPSFQELRSDVAFCGRRRKTINDFVQHDLPSSKKEQLAVRIYFTVITQIIFDTSADRRWIAGSLHSMCNRQAWRKIQSAFRDIQNWATIFSGTIVRSPSFTVQNTNSGRWYPFAKGRHQRYKSRDERSWQQSENCVTCDNLRSTRGQCQTPDSVVCVRMSVDGR